MSENEFNEKIEEAYSDMVQNKGILADEAFKMFKKNCSKDNSDDPYMTAIFKWREDSKELFKNPEDAEFLKHAFEKKRS